MKKGSLEGKSVFDLFPDLANEVVKKSKSGIRIPQPPDTSWLREGLPETNNQETSDSLRALVVLIEDNKRILVRKILREMGYTITYANTAAHAKEIFGSFHYNLILCGNDLIFKEFHNYICSLPSAKRRVIYYVLVGTHLHTLYDLEALTLSANLIINDRDLKKLKIILRKGLDDYEKLFRPLLDELSVNHCSF